jgi:cellulase
MECAQLNVIGGGNAKPPTVSIPGLYKQNDPGILFNVGDFSEGGRRTLADLDRNGLIRHRPDIPFLDRLCLNASYPRYD